LLHFLNRHIRSHQAEAVVPILYRVLAFDAFDDFSTFVKSINLRNIQNLIIMWFESMPGSHFLEPIIYKRVAFPLYEFWTDASQRFGRTH